MKYADIKEKYGEEGLANHKSYVDHKNKLSRDRKRENNEKNLSVIKEIKSEFLNKTIGENTVMSINETVDGVGFWVNTVTDNGYKERGFFSFNDYKEYKQEALSKFIKYL